MGIADDTFAYLANRIAPLGLGRSCVTLGKQHVSIAPERALQIAAEAGLTRPAATGGHEFAEAHPFVRTLRNGGVTARTGMITDVALMNLLGFDDVHSIDASGFEGADILMDLNDGNAAARLGRTFEFVYDGGTLEHVFHVPSAMKNIYDLLVDGGRILHISPSNNYVDHGFYQFSPTFFYDYYSVNNFSILRCDFFQHSREVNAPYRLMTYMPGSLDGISFGGLDAALYGVMFLAQKNAKSTWNVIPQQGAYGRQSAWRQGRPDGSEASASAQAPTAE